ncbi:hypothetical protein BT67DRAFT_186225 [Trichocladium antarcticum]|uniref:Uncharacterized protein n=1 Tax=Trichocladium antarcticum TaxID=1450529 RepID=A0AAN6ZEY9_9PEZI|nr:hypothetical protein BT67DRAFT_186225 [Trichocladium antarcticum]
MYILNITTTGINSPQANGSMCGTVHRPIHVCRNQIPAGAALRQGCRRAGGGPPIDDCVMQLALKAGPATRILEGQNWHDLASSRPVCSLQHQAPTLRLPRDGARPQRNQCRHCFDQDEMPRNQLHVWFLGPGNTTPDNGVEARPFGCLGLLPRNFPNYVGH